MLAEIKKKNVERDSEDQLTGNIFGALRYIPFNEGMGYILSHVTYNSDGSSIENISNQNDWSDCIDLWRNVPAYGEPDIIIEFGNTIILIEVKLYSGISSDDELKDCSGSIHQLSRYSRYLVNEFEDKKKVLIILAKESDAYKIWKDAQDRKKVGKEVLFGYISWTDICIALEEQIGTLEETDKTIKIVMQDMIDLLKSKNLDEFKNFFDIQKLADEIKLDNIWVINDSEESNSISYNFILIERENYYVYG